MPIVSNTPISLASQHLCTGAVGAGHQHRVVDRRQAHEPAEAADTLEHQRMVDRLEPLLEQSHGFVAGRHVDARVFVGEVLVGGHDPPSSVLTPSRPLFYGTGPVRASATRALTLAAGRRRGRRPGLRLRRRSCGQLDDGSPAGQPHRRRRALRRALEQATADDRHQHPPRGSRRVVGVPPVGSPAGDAGDRRAKPSCRGCAASSGSAPRSSRPRRRGAT